MNNISNIKYDFFKDSINDIWDYYSNVLKKNIKTWDWVIITASNEKQAKNFELELNYRKKIGKLPLDINYMVVPDIEGKRIGSGGATLNAIKEIKKNDDRAFNDLKILIIHSGGDSKRVPQYSACGKLFSPTQRMLNDGRVATLFDELFISFLSVSNRMGSGVLMLSGDILMVFNPLQIDLFYNDAAAISVKEQAEVGINHGVFLSDTENYLSEFLHKQSINTLKTKKAINSLGNVDIDTGAIYFSSNVIEKLYNIVKKEDDFSKYINDSVRLNLYGDFIYPLSKNVTIDDYLMQESEGNDSKIIKEARKKIWNNLNGCNMRIIKTSPSKFIHFGTTKELLNLTTTQLHKYKFLGWNHSVLCNQNCDKYTANTSYISSDVKVGKNCYIENSYIDNNCHIGDNVILSNVNISNIQIPSNYCFSTLKQLDGTYVTRVYCKDDNPKLDCYNNETIFLQDHFNEIIDYYNIDKNLLFDTPSTIICS